MEPHALAPATAAVQGRLQNAIDIASFSLPLAAQNLLGYSLNALGEALVGRLGPACLSASTLANSTYSLMGLSLVWGGAAGMETLCGQAHGAGNRVLMRRVLVRAVLVCWGVCVPVTCLWGAAGPLLRALGQAPALVETCAEYLRALAPSMFFYVLTECLQTYLVVQGRTRPTAAAKAVVTALGPLFYWGCMFGLNLGLVGAGYAYALVKATNAALLLGCLVWSEGRGTATHGSAEEPAEGRPEASSAAEASGAAACGILRTEAKEYATCSSSSGNGDRDMPTEERVRARDDTTAVAASESDGLDSGRSSVRRVGSDGSSGYGRGAGAGYAGRPDAHEEMLTSPLAAAASAHEFSLGSPLQQNPYSRGNGDGGADGDGGGGGGGGAVAALAAASTAVQPGRSLNVAAAPAAASAAAVGMYGRLAAAAAALRAEAAEALDPRACWEYVKFGTPAAVMSCLEWWAYEALVIMAGWLPDAEVALGCLGICLTVGGWAYMVPQAISTAACARVANALGAGDAEGAKRTFQSAVLLVLVSQCALAALLAPNARAVAAAFCPDPAAAALAASLLPITAVNTIADGLNCVLNGTLRAAGRQALGARLHLLGHWGCGLPAAYTAAFTLGMGVRGVVVAVGAVSFCQSLLVAGIISRWDWHTEVRNSAALLSSLASTSASTSSSDSLDT